MKRIYKKIFDPNFYGEVRKTFLGWTWSFFRDNETLPLSKGKEIFLEHAILVCNNEASRLSDLFHDWSPVHAQESSQDNSGSK